MNKMMRIDSIPKAFAFLLGLFSLGLMGFGIFNESYWFGFGIVLSMTSAILITGLSGLHLDSTS